MLSALVAALPAAVIFVSVLSVPLSAAADLGLARTELSSWLVAIYAIPGGLGLLLALRYRQPLLLTGNLLAIILFASLAGQLPFSDLIGATMLAGSVVVALAGLGLTDRLATWIPSPIVFGLLAGVVLPFVTRIFTTMAAEPVLVIAAFVAYLAGRRFLASPAVPMLAAIAAGLLVAGSTGALGPLPTLTLPSLVVSSPTLSFEAVATVTPVVVVLMTLQANVPSIVVIRDEGYAPPQRAVEVASGLGAIGGSLFGPTAVSMPLPVVPLLAGSLAGPPERRHLVAMAAGGALVIVGALAGFAVGLLEFIPVPLLFALAGLALLPVFAESLRNAAVSRLRLGPLITFLIAQSGLSLFGFGAFLWALVAGIGVSLLLEREELQALRDERETVAGSSESRAGVDRSP